MKWTELKSDIVVNDFEQLVRDLDFSNTVRLLVNLYRGNHLYIVRNCLNTVMNHVNSDNKEVGGLLLGRVWEYKPLSETSLTPIVFVMDSVASKYYKNSQASLEMSTEIWNQINSRSPDKLIVVGWYHSHPNLGAFFSGTDRKTQRSFFNQFYSIGWVIDPLRNEEKVFLGRDSQEYLSGFKMVINDLEILTSGRD